MFKKIIQTDRAKTTILIRLIVGAGAFSVDARISSLKDDPAKLVK